MEDINIINDIIKELDNAKDNIEFMSYCEYTEEVTDQLTKMINKLKLKKDDWIYGYMTYVKSRQRWSLDIWPFDNVAKGRKTFSCSSKVWIKEQGFWEKCNFRHNGKYYLISIDGRKFDIYEGMLVRLIND